jgi:hypothetical protein
MTPADPRPVTPANNHHADAWARHHNLQSAFLTTAASTVKTMSATDDDSNDSGGDAALSLPPIRSRFERRWKFDSITDVSV